MKYSLLSILVTVLVASTIFSQNKKYLSSKEKMVKLNKAPLLIENEQGAINHNERGLASAPIQTNSILIDSSHNGYGYSSSVPKSIDIATDVNSGDAYAGVSYRGYIPSDPTNNSGILVVSELNISQGFDYANVSRFDYINNVSPFGNGARFPSFQAAPEGPVPVWNQFISQSPAPAPNDTTESVAYLSFDFFGWGPSGGGWITPEDWAQNSPHYIAAKAPWLGSTDIYKDPSGVYHVGGIWELDLNRDIYTFLHGTSTDLNNWTWDPGINPVDVGWTSDDIIMNSPVFAWGTNGFGAWVSDGYIQGTGDTDFKLMLCTTNDYGATWSAIQRFEFSELGIPEMITADDSIFIPEDTLNPYVGPAEVGMSYDFDLIATPNNTMHVGATIIWGPPVPNMPGFYYPHGLHMGFYDVSSADAGQHWTPNRIWWNSGLLVGDSSGVYTTNEIDLGYDDAGNIYAAWLDRGRLSTVLAPFPVQNPNITTTYNLDVWASISLDGGSTWSQPPRRITNDSLNCAQGLRLATRTKWFPEDAGKTYMVYQIADLTRPLPAPTTLVDHVQWLYIAEAKDFTTSIKTVKNEIPRGFTLHQNYPNPFNPKTTIRFEIIKSSKTELSVYNTLGQRVATLVNEQLNPGVYDYQWDASSLASGVYFYKLKTPEVTQVKKMVLMK